MIKSLTRYVGLYIILLLAACSGNTQTDETQEEADFIAAQSEFLADNALRGVVITTPTGLQYEILVEAEGEKPLATDTITINYTGTLIDGEEFDSSFRRGEPSTFVLSGLIAGWVEGLQLMSVGSEYRLYIPANLAYGDQGFAPQIRPHAALIFTIELLEINAR